MKEYKHALLRELDQHAERTESEERVRLGALVANLRDERSAQRSTALRWLSLTAAVAATAVVAAVFMWNSFDNREPAVELPPRAAPREAIASFSGTWSVGDTGPVGEGKTVQVPEGRGARLNIGANSRVWIAEGAGFAVQDGSAERIVLLRGRVLVSVDPAERLSLVVESPFGGVHVRGTVFSVNVEEGAVSVRLYRGAVEFVRDEAEAHALLAGDALEVGGDAGLTARRRRLTSADALDDLSIGEWSGPGVFPDLLSMTGALHEDPAPLKAEPRPPLRNRPPRGIVKTVDEQATVGDED